jgi:hypothetical protein
MTDYYILILKILENEDLKTIDKDNLAKKIASAVRVEIIKEFELFMSKHKEELNGTTR